MFTVDVKQQCNIEAFNVIGKALSGELSCMQTLLVVSPVINRNLTEVFFAVSSGFSAVV